MNAIIIPRSAPDSEVAPFTVDIGDGERFYVVTVRANVPCTAGNLRRRTALALEVAVAFEKMAAREGHTYKVDTSQAHDGVVTVEIAPEGEPPTPEGHDVMLEITVDACASAGLGPSPD